MLAWSFSTDFNCMDYYTPAVLFLEPLSEVAEHRSQNQFFGCIFKDKYITSAALTPGPEDAC